jgi:hypothetical protein
MKTLMDRLQVEEDKLDQEQEDSHEEYEKMKAVFEKRIDLYKRFLKSELTDRIDRLMLQNKKEWTMNHLLNLIQEKELGDRITDLTQCVYQLEEAELLLE